MINSQIVAMITVMYTFNFGEQISSIVIIFFFFAQQIDISFRYHNAIWVGTYTFLF